MPSTGESEGNLDRSASDDVADSDHELEMLRCLETLELPGKRLGEESRILEDGKAARMLRAP